MTIDQLSYVLERKYINIRIHHDVIIACLTDHQMIDGTFHQTISDAFISEWRIDYIDRPTNGELDLWWELLKDQYNSDPYRPDSEMSQFLNSRSSTKLPIVSNPDL